MIKELSLGCIVVLFVFVVVLTLGLELAMNRINELEQRMSYEVSKIADDFLQEDDYYPNHYNMSNQLRDLQQRLERLERR